jgi:tRNA pseudouridine55 synthase
MMIKKGISDLPGLDFQAGQVIMIDKPLGWTSFKVVHKLRQILGVKKIGHAGTLDPLATGLLILATGKKTKEIDSYQAQEKTYTGTITLGKTSPSMDLETEPDAIYSVTGITKEDILKARDKFRGKIQQIPPMYSAVKFQGKTMYNLARKGKVIELTPREIEIKEFEITSVDIPEVHFRIVCSKGTYIRVIAHEIGKELGCGGILSSLRRSNIGEYSVDEAFSMDEIKDLFPVPERAAV